MSRRSPAILAGAWASCPNCTNAAGSWKTPQGELTVNYGTEKVRFPAPVPVGSRVRATAVCDSVTPIDGGVQMLVTVTVE